MTTPRLRLNPADPRFADLVLADISRIRATNVGRTVFRRLLDAGCSVTIDKPLPPTSPPNAWTRLANPDQRGGDTVIAYDPADWPEPAALGAPPSDVVLFGRLLDAIAMTSGKDTAELSDTGIPAEVEAYLKERTARLPLSAGTNP
jgi:hypothetical protein